MVYPLSIISGSVPGSVDRQRKWDCDNLTWASLGSGLTLSGTGAMPSM